MSTTHVTPEDPRKAIVDDWYRARAKELHEEEGTLEIDSNAVVSMGDDPGAYVAAWVWVPAPDAETGDD